MKMLLSEAAGQASTSLARGPGSCWLAPPPRSALFRLRPLLSVLKRPPRWEPGLPPTERPDRHKSLSATAADWSAHTKLANAPVVQASGHWSRAVVDRGSEHHPTCDALCLLPLSSRPDASRAGTDCSRPTSAHRGRSLLQPAPESPVAGAQNSDAPVYRFSAPRCGYHSSDTDDYARAAPRSLSLSTSAPDAD